jgi:hypothetical protein
MRRRTQALLGLAAVATLGVSAQAAFVAYNDCQSTGASNPANTTTIGYGGSGTSGVLKDFATGAATGVNVAVVISSGVNTEGSGPTAEFPAGSDAGKMFNGKAVNTGNVIYYASTAGWTVDLVFTGLAPGQLYNFATTLDRGDSSPAPAGGYPDRWTRISISDADSYTYASSAGAVKISDSTTSIQSYNTINGYMAQWTSINAGADGDFTIRFTHEPTNGALSAPYPAGASQNTTRGYGPSVFALSTVPEPATLGMLGVAALGLIRRRRAN